MSVQAPPIEYLWKQVGFTPNRAQRQAILHVDGPLYLPAGPGAGKTRVLLWRTLHLIVHQHVAPSEIFLATFTEKAALQLQEGLRSLLSMVTNITGVNYDIGEMYVGTVHSLCQRMISDRSLRKDRRRIRPPQLLDALGQYFHLVDRHNWSDVLVRAGVDANTVVGQINAAFGRQSESRHSAAINLISFCNRLAEEYIHPAVALDGFTTDPALTTYFADAKLSEETISLFLKLAVAYNALLQEQGVTTFSLLQQRAYESIDDLRPGCFRYIIIDEYQDTNSIQERIFFKLARTHTNLCVVGDDDQALYRFRGATVENFVQFPARCRRELQCDAIEIPLAVNYRSRKGIVDFYTDFMRRCDWSQSDGQGEYRVTSKQITAHSADAGVAVVSTAPDVPVRTCAEIAQLVRELIDNEVVSDANQIAFLFPSLQWQGTMNEQVARMKHALEEVGLQVYAPRAGRFLDVEEAVDVFGIFAHIFGAPDINPEIRGSDYANYRAWIDTIRAKGSMLMAADPYLQRFVNQRRDEIATIMADLAALRTTVNRYGWSADATYDPDTMKRPLLNTPGLSARAIRSLSSNYLDSLVQRRWQEGRPYPLKTILNRATALDWSPLDLFYQLCGFEHFSRMFDLAEQGIDEGPICNLGLITQYISRFMESYITIPTASNFEERRYQNRLFGSFLFALYRLGESEFEDPDDPFPRGRIPFLTIHQSKGLEFPVVILSNPRKDDRGPTIIEKMIRPFLQRTDSEPLNRMSEFDIMRMFYVALSRAQNLLVLANLRGPGQRISPPIRATMEEKAASLATLPLDTIPPSQHKREQISRPYSYTGDFLAYKRCGRQYMVFRKYGFVPSQSQTMFFGSLIHRTLEDLHNHLIAQRSTNV